jgi:PhnB protein
MSIKSLSPYINLNGTADEAIQLYQSALGAKAETVLHYGEVPGMNAPPDQKNLVMHAALSIGGGTLMLNDEAPNRPVPTEGNVQVSLDFTNPEEMAKAFHALAEGGKITLPVQDTFWGAKFGMLTDAYGVRWMFNCQTKKP